MRTTSSWWLLSMAEVFRHKGLPVARMFAEAGLSLQSLAHQSTRYPQDGVTRLWDVAETCSGSDRIGLEVGSQVSLTGFPVLAYSLITAAGLVDGFSRFQRYQRMIGEAADIQLVSHGGQMALEFRFRGDEIPVSRHTIDAAVAAMVKMARLLEGGRWAPERIALCRRAPGSVQPFESYFGCEVAFGASADRIYFDTATLAEIDPESEISGDPLLQLEARQTEKPTAELVIMLLNSKLQDGGLSRQQVADQLNITARTLQRRLAREGESFQGILDRVRHQKALEALANPLLLPIEVAFLCGFSDLTAFHHAFRRWQGQTPGEYRASILNRAE